ncbi:MAG: ABC transporter ATP-binding protein [Vicinamibacterales bacterium]|nr:ABC transporter ATP-binding protein [Vicinamibacterales bacterium]
MSSEIALSVQGLGKQYQIGVRTQQAGTLRERIAMGAAAIGRRLSGREGAEGPTESLWALKDVSFDVPRGEVVGVIGGNGAGKSTLLKVLSRITQPTEGRAVISGRVGALLEVSTGFHPELTGRENVFLNGAILGMSRAEIVRKFDEIVEFSGVDRFIDTPVRFYSSGMYVRLAFAVAAHLEPEILFVDEVLAVGDAQFQKKCLGKMSEVSRAGRTILFVSHNLEAVQRMCSRGLLFERGRLVESGSIDDVIARYRTAQSSDDLLGRFRPASRRGVGYARVEDVRLLVNGQVTGQVPCDADLVIECLVSTAQGQPGKLQGHTLELTLCGDDGVPLCSLMNVDDGGAELPSVGSCWMRVSVPGPTFVPGRYRLNTFLGIPNLLETDSVFDGFEFEVLPPVHPWRPYELTRAHGIVCRRASWSVVEAPMPSVAP